MTNNDTWAPIFIVLGALFGMILIDQPEFTDIATPLPDPLAYGYGAGNQPTPTASPAPVLYDTVPAQTPEIQSPSQFNDLLRFLKNDPTDRTPYNRDPATVYENQYACAHYTRDLIHNASLSGITLYAMHLKGQSSPGPLLWHMIVLTQADGEWYIIEPQNDNIYGFNYTGYVYPFTHAYIGKQVTITRNHAYITDPIRSLPGLFEGDYIYLENKQI